jgi:nitrogen fixation NifU-like protein
MALTNDVVAEALDGLPAPKLHCSNLAADALHEAIKNYRETKG